MPRNIPAAWIHHIELTLWDPAYPSHRRVFKNTESECTRASFVGKPFISKMWDGKLWATGDGKPDPQNPNDFYYTQASDFFMQAIVYWRPAYPVPGCTEGGSHVHSAACWKPWENGNYESSDEFQEDRYAIVVEDYDWGPVSGDPYNFAWISSTPLMPLLEAYLVAKGRAALPQNAYWNIQITFPRPDLGGQDYSVYPAAAPAFLPAGQSFVPDFGTDKRGGKAEVRCLFEDGSELLIHEFQIRGYNPVDSTAETYINDHCGNNHWYALPIARQESKLGMAQQQPSNPEYTTFVWNGQTILAGAMHDQFYPWRYRDRQPDIDPHKPDPPSPSDDGYPGNPLHRHDPPYVGHGIMQITNPKASANEVWNWQANIDRGISILEQRRQDSSFSRTSDTRGLPSDLWVMGYYFTYYGGLWLGRQTYHDLDTIKRFNSGLFFSHNPATGWTQVVTLPPDNSSPETLLDYTQRVMRFN